MQSRKRGRTLWLIKWLSLVALGLAAMGALVAYNTGFIVDMWWFQSLGLGGYFLKRLMFGPLVFAGVFLIFFLLFFINFWFASRYLGNAITESVKKDEREKKSVKDLIMMFQQGSLKVYTPISLLMAIPIAMPFYEKWEEILLFVFSGKSGATDPALGNDISYYLFSYPIFSLVQSRLLIGFSVLLLGVLLLCWIEKRILAAEKQKLPKGATLHISGLIFVLCLIQSWGFWLQRHDLLYTTSHMDLFFGPGFLEKWFSQSMIFASIISLAGVALSLIYYINTKKWWKLLAVMGGCFALIFVIRYIPFVPNMIEKNFIKSNQYLEEPFIKNSISSTFAAYKLGKSADDPGRLKITDYDLGNKRMIQITPELKQSLKNIPLWDRALLDKVFEQVQGIRSYFSFSEPDVGKYQMGGLSQQVYLAARELNTEKLSKAAKNWQNMYFLYTHGYGAVMIPAAQVGDEPMVWNLHNIPMESEYGISVAQPDIYYGLENYPYCIAPNDLGELDFSRGGKATINYSGKGGIPISNLFQKLFFSFHLKEKRLLFTRNTNEKSRILIRRNITRAVETVTPFLTQDSDPYLVAAPNGFFWIIDAYTTSKLYPCSEPIVSGGLNYIRNSVKIVVDAYNGTINYYVMDRETKDPIISAYQKIYPSLFKSIKEMPDELKKHVRYPRDMFDMQMQIFAKYHQDSPDIFYNHEDNWDFASLGEKRMKPYYLNINPKNPEKQEHILLSPMSPSGTDNLRALAFVGCELGSNYGKMTVYGFDPGKQHFGPAQISAMIDQDTVIAQELSLWDQGGSEVKRGRMLILPVGKTIVYIQPVYILSAAKQKIPELKRIFISQGDVVVMDKSLEGAFMKLKKRLEGAAPKPAAAAPKMEIIPVEAAPAIAEPKPTEAPATTPEPELKPAEAAPANPAGEKPKEKPES